jgi:Acyltransferase family
MKAIARTQYQPLEVPRVEEVQKPPPGDMVQRSVRPTETSPMPAPSGKTPRLFFIDHLRAALVVLVVLHHVALVYGAAAPFYYVEPPTNAPLTFLALLVFVLFNQAWFMGALFLIAGYFTPGSFERKGPGPFLQGRLLRLGVPLVIFFFVLNPISATGYWQMPSSLTGITSPLTWQAYPFLLGMGPMWFVAMLLVFDFGYAAWRRLTGNRAPAPVEQASFPSYLRMGVFILALALASYLTRIVVPLGKDVLGFPTLAYLPQYLSFFVIGIVASHRDWFRNFPRSMGVVGIVTAVVVTAFLFPLALSGRLFSFVVAEPVGFVGNGHWQSAVYVLWDSIFAVGLCLGAISLFRRFFNGQGRLGSFLSQHSYAVYFIHTPIVVFAAIALKGLQIAPMLKFGLVAVIAVPACFAAAFILRRMPFAARIL